MMESEKIQKKEMCFRHACVTGGSGFIGRNLVERLLEKGCTVTCLLRRKVNFLDVSGVTQVLGDLSDIEKLKQTVRGADVVYHLAGAVKALTSEEMYRVNTDGTRRIAEACAEQPNPPVFLYVSSLAASGKSRKKRPHTENDIPSPSSVYGRSKYEAENVLRKLSGRMPITIIRPGIVFGPHEKLVRLWLTSVRRMGILFVPALRKYEFSMISSTDLIEIMMRAAAYGERLIPSGNELPPEMGHGIYFASYTTHPTYIQMGRLMGTAVGRPGAFSMGMTPFIFTCVCFISELIGRMRERASFINLDKLKEAISGSWTGSSEKARRQLGVDLNGMVLKQRLHETWEWIEKTREV